MSPGSEADPRPPSGEDLTAADRPPGEHAPAVAASKGAASQPADDPVAPDDGNALPPHGDPLGEVAVVPVTEGGEAAETGPALADAVAEAAAAHLAELKQTLGSLRLEGTQTTGVPAVDEALQRLGELDPENLAGSAQVLEDVLQRLEQALQETPQD